MDFKEISDNMVIGRKALHYLLSKMTFSNGKADENMNAYGEACVRVLKDSNFLINNMCWIESMDVVDIKRGMKEISVKLPDFSTKKWLVDKDKKPENFSLQLERLLNEMQNMKIPRPIVKRKIKPVKKFNQNRELRSMSPNTSECSSVEILDYDDESIATITPEDSSSDSSFDECLDEEFVETNSISAPKYILTHTTLDQKLKEDREENTRTYSLDGSLDSVIEVTPVNDMLDRIQEIKLADNRLYLASYNNSNRNQCRDDRSVTSKSKSPRYSAMKRKAALIVHDKFTHQSQWLTPPLAVNSRVGNSINNNCKDMRRWLVRY